MKRSPLKRIGRIGRANIEANRRLKEYYQSNGITQCEIGLNECMENWGLGTAHRHKRDWYKGDVAKLSAPNQTILACSRCHETIEHDPDLTEEIFIKLRGKEDET